MNIVGVHKDAKGTITDYKMSNGLVLSHAEAVNMVESGQITGYNVSTAKSGLKSIRSNPDGDTSNNLDSLSSF